MVLNTYTSVNIIPKTSLMDLSDVLIKLEISIMEHSPQTLK